MCASTWVSSPLWAATQQIKANLKIDWHCNKLWVQNKKNSKNCTKNAHNEQFNGRKERRWDIVKGWAAISLRSGAVPEDAACFINVSINNCGWLHKMTMINYPSTQHYSQWSWYFAYRLRWLAIINGRSSACLWQVRKYQSPGFHLNAKRIFWKFVKFVSICQFSVCLLLFTKQKPISSQRKHLCAN